MKIVELVVAFVFGLVVGVLFCAHVGIRASKSIVGEKVTQEALREAEIAGMEARTCWAQAGARVAAHAAAYRLGTTPGQAEHLLRLIQQGGGPDGH